MRVACTTQRDHEWFAAKCGRVGASGVAKVMNFLKSGKSSAERDKYMLEVACELITGTQQEHYVSQAMEIGIQYESEARRAYFLRTGVDPKQTGFVLHPTLDYFGASPDGLLGKDGVLELKCPLPSTHWAYIRDGVVPDIYVPQVQAQMLCCERQYADFVSYCPPELYPDVPARFRLFIKRIEASPQLHRAMEDAVTTFMGEVAALVKKLDAACPELPKEADDDLGELGLTDADIAWAAGGFKKEEMP